MSKTKQDKQNSSYNNAVLSFYLVHISIIPFYCDDFYLFFCLDIEQFEDTVF